MKVLDLSCNRCGASLDVPEKVNFVTCTFCGTKLKIERSGAAAYTEALEQIADDLKVLRRQAEVDRLDRRWHMRRDELLVSDKEGRRHVPTKAGTTAGVVFVVVAGLAWMAFASQLHAGFALFGLVFIAFGVMAAMQQMRRADEYARERATYERERAALLADADE